MDESTLAKVAKMAEMANMAKVLKVLMMQRDKRIRSDAHQDGAVAGPRC
jgi:hypothetical protein